MFVAGVAPWLATLAIVGMRTGVAVLLGMLGPLVVAVGTWVLTERTYKRDPGRVTALMVGAFGGKMVFFGAYVAVMLRLFAVRPVPFVASFTSYFIALYLIEALYLRRLFLGSGRPQGPPVPGSAESRVPGEPGERGGRSNG
jgi:hypothetical protein